MSSRICIRFIWVETLTVKLHCVVKYASQVTWKDSAYKMLRYCLYGYSEMFFVKFNQIILQKKTIFKTTMITVIVTEILNMPKITTIEKNLCEFYLIFFINSVLKDVFFWSGSINLTNHGNMCRRFICHGKTFYEISLMIFSSVDEIEKTRG